MRVQIMVRSVPSALVNVTSQIFVRRSVRMSMIAFLDMEPRMGIEPIFYRFAGGAAHPVRRGMEPVRGIEPRLSRYKGDVLNRYHYTGIKWRPRRESNPPTTRRQRGQFTSFVRGH